MNPSFDLWHSKHCFYALEHLAFKSQKLFVCRASLTNRECKYVFAFAWRSVRMYTRGIDHYLSHQYPDNQDGP
jgi:hypothetical protein